MNLQCVFTGEAFVESDIVQTLLKGTNSSCPLLSAKDSAMLWQSMSFMQDAADQTAQLSEASSTMYDFLERLLVHSGILLPLAVSGEPTYFVPSLLPQAEPGNIWTYKTSDSWMTTLCHSWLLRDGAPSSVMEHVTTSLLQDLYEFSNTFQGTTTNRTPRLRHAQSFPMGATSLHETLERHDLEAIGRIKIHQVMCWKSSILVKIGTVFADHDCQAVRESFSEIYVSLVDDQSTHCVATSDMTVGQKRLIVCGKGSVGHFGRKLWKGGYALVLDSIKAALADFTGVDRQVICPECLAHFHPSLACPWSWDNVLATARTGSSGLRCFRGHHVNTNLLCGTCSPATPKPAPGYPAEGGSFRVPKPVSSILPSVVLVGLWDPQEKQIRSVGSGVVVDKRYGLIMTAAHVLFDMVDGRKFGLPYFGVENAKVVVGVIPGDGHTAVFRYFGELVAHDIQTVDACVIRITTRMGNDVKDEGEGCAFQSEIPIGDMREENLSQLKMTRKFELEENVRILGFNQGGEGIFLEGKHINRSVDFARGYIVKSFRSWKDDDSNSDSSMSSSFAPREEIVVMCSTISGHSGGPCVNGEGKVVGILSRADPVERQRCYLAPSSELKILLQKAKSQGISRDLFRPAGAARAASTASAQTC
jgi:S1-C subfamily serine protease